MNKCLLITLFFFLQSPAIIAQNTYGNEWIDYSAKYYRFPILADGFYKIDYQTLSDAGINPSQFNSANMQIFGREREEALYVYDGGDNQMDPGDFFVFYGQRNDGWLDSTLFEIPETIGNPAVSMFCDTVYYFFTWNNSTNNLRYTPEFNDNYSFFPQLNYGMTKLEYNVANPVYFQAKDEVGFSRSAFMPGEGFSTDNYNGVQFPDGMKLLPYFYTNHLYTGSDAPPAKFHSKSSSNSDADSVGNFEPVYNHHLRVTLGSMVVTDTLFNGYHQIIINEDIPVSALTNFSTSGEWHVVNDLNVKADQQVFSYMSLTYPRKPALHNSQKDRFHFKNNNINGQVRIDIANASSNLNHPLIFIRGSRPKKPGYTFANDTVKVMVTNSNNGEDQELLILDSSLLVPIVSLLPINGTGSFTNFDAVNFENANLMIYHPSMKTASTDYEAYRSSAAGGSYNVVKANIEELYLQFGGGIPKHNAAIRRFAHFAYNNSIQKPLALTILGKGLGIDKIRTNATLFNNSMIPPYGYPSSDIAFTAGLEGTINEPLIPTGRIAAENEAEMYYYLNKLKEFELEQVQSVPYSSANKDWQKQVLHFSGGDSDALIKTIRAFMYSFEKIIQDSVFAGQVTTFQKTVSNPYDPSMVIAIGEKIRAGASILNFFGHSTADGFDISVDDPTDWDNAGKYPVILGNGCQSGDIYAVNKSFSERAVILPNEGGIAMLASTASETTSTLYQYCSELYKQISYKNYGQPLAKQVQQTIKLLQQMFPNGIGYELRTTYGAVNLNGDPLLKINYHSKPEFELTEENVFFTPDNIDLSIDTITLNVVVKNLGVSNFEPIEIEVVRKFANSPYDSIYRVTLKELHYNDTIEIKMPLLANLSAGINQFNITVDIPSYVTEQSDDAINNQLQKTLILNLDAIIPVYPYEYSVIPEKQFSVKASTIDPILSERTFRFELDTVKTFDSPFLRHYSLFEKGGVKSVRYDQWLDVNDITSPVIPTDSLVLFWRVARDSSTLLWSESSFQYIEDHEGWGQAHFHQFLKNDLSSVAFDTLARLREFAPINKSIEIYGTHNIPYALTSYYYEIEKNQVDYGQCGALTLINVAVMDSLTLEPWFTRFGTQNPNNNFGNMNDNGGCSNRPMGYFAFDQNDPAQMASFRNFMDNVIPNGNYYALWTTVNGLLSIWDPAMFTTFANLGSAEINASSPDRSFIMFGKKGYLSEFKEIVVPLSDLNTVNYKLYLEGEIKSTDYAGTETSTLIGPTENWKNFYWKLDSNDPSSGDTTRLTFQLRDYYGNVQSTIDTLINTTDSILNLETLFGATHYPYLTLRASYEDATNFTPAQMDRWHVLFDPVPEAAIDGTAGFEFSPSSDTIIEGQDILISANIANISSIDMDSMLVHYWLEDEAHVKHYFPPRRLDSLRVGQVIKDTISFSTIGHGGYNTFWMEINPYKNGISGETDQPEQYHFNNLLQFAFHVVGDDLNPILDVTFNGRHILNGDIVDPNSEIYITLKDDNPYLIMNDSTDTDLFGVYLTSPDGVQTKIPFYDDQGNVVMQWIPADAATRKFKIIWPAEFKQDGTYKLLVQGSDRSGNISGDLEYEVNFEVIHESSITYLTNYPNPFSTSTRFVFTLTGSEVPDDMLIQIMTISGKVVREITMDELGPIQIGRNITEFSWNGTDQFGDPLANGVYLYRVITRLNGEEIKHRDSELDKYFRKEFGKMYLMR